MSNYTKAVFLSYASQDKEVAHRICGALRAAGVEVWFDQSELRGGDAWDAKIRKQIKECALFVPVITPATNARPEGYFRLEWKLAVDRSHLMADDAPFLFPIVVGDVNDATARVPDKFRDVQWTRLRPLGYGGQARPAGEDPEVADLAGRVAKLLSGNVGASLDDARGRRQAAPLQRARWQWWMIFPILGTIMSLMFAAVPFWKSMQRSAQRDRPKVEAPAAPVKPVVSPLVQQGREMLERYTVDDTQRESLTLAEELAKRAVQADATDADAWSLQAQIASSYITTARDRLPARFAALTAAAERAMQLAPDSDEALFARAVAYRRRTATREEAERILRDLVQRNPDDRRMLRAQGNTLRLRQASEEALAVFRQSAALSGGDARAELFCAEVLQGLGRLEEAAAAADRSFAVQPTGSVRLFKVNLACLRGDLARARAELATMPPTVLLDDRGAAVAANVWLWSREPEKVIAALEVIPGDDLYNAFFYGPKSLMLGFAHQLAGREEVAKVQWRIASRNLDDRAAADPSMMIDPLYLGTKMFLDFLIGDPDKRAGAMQMLRVYAQMGVTVDMDPAWDPAKLFTLLGRQDIMIDFAEMILKSGEMPGLREQLRTDKRYDPLRGNPRFDALLVEPQEMSTTGEALLPTARPHRHSSGMGATTKAVFLSYASQDAEVVRAIAEAMRAGGLEVWFDQAELRGGDAWDQKIRRQIRDCTLFMPVISANTQARGEGYFRREWKLAVERTMDMADGVPYLFPLVLDGVPDRDALVPEVFRHVQWTRVGAAGLPPAFVANVRALLEGTPAPESAVSERSSPRPAAPGRDRQGGRPRWLFPAAIFALIAGVAVAIYAVRDQGGPAAQVPPAKAAPPESTQAAPASATLPALDPRRVALARFENLTGDASLDNIARLLESDLTRGLGTLPSVRLLPIEASSRATARAAAREAGASSVIVGSYLKQGDQIEVSAEIVLVTAGEVFGAVGPASTPAASLRGPALAEFVDRLTTGAHNVSVTLQNPPTRMAAVTYNRPWPRWSMAARNQAIRASGSGPEELNKAVEQYRAILAEAPEMLKTKHDLARLLMGLGRLDESQKLFRELLGPDRSRLSEAELLAVTYDEAMLAGDPDRAMTAARGLLEIRPISDAISQLVSCLWAQNRPRAAFTELERWWQANQEALPEQGRRGNQLGVIASEALMHLQEDHPEKTLATLERVGEAAPGQPFPAAFWLKGAALATLGREDERRQMVEAAAMLPAASGVEPVSLNWQGYLIALHRGRPGEAQRWLAAALKSWDDMPAARREDNQFLSTGVALNLAAGRYEDALRGADLLMARFPEMASVIGYRALVLTAMGRAEEAAPLVKRLEQWDSRNARGLPQYWRARLAVRTGDKARTVELLRQAVAGGLWFGGYNSPTFDFARSEPEFAVLRGYAPYEQLLKPKG